MSHIYLYICGVIIILIITQIIIEEIRFYTSYQCTKNFKQYPIKRQHWHVLNRKHDKNVKVRNSSGTFSSFQSLCGSFFAINSQRIRNRLMLISSMVILIIWRICGGQENRKASCFVQRVRMSFHDICAWSCITQSADEITNYCHYTGFVIIIRIHESCRKVSMHNTLSYWVWMHPQIIIRILERMIKQCSLYESKY